MSEWKKYEGTDEQIAEMLQADLFIVDSNLSCFHDPAVFKMPATETYISWLREKLDSTGITQYLICEPHPLAEMIKRWADTGQPVWIKIFDTYGKTSKTSDYTFVAAYLQFSVYKTTNPDWNIPNAEYSFTPFE